MKNKVELAELIKLSRIVENFKNNVLGIDIAVDQVHDPDRGAAGWIRELKIDQSTSRPDKKALFGRVEWTPVGKEIVGAGIFKYISAEFGTYVDPETGKKYEDVLFAATLTNRPFVKGMKPVSLDDPWIEILREGDYMHAYYGELNIKAEDAGFLRKLYWGLKRLFEGGAMSDMSVDNEKKNEYDLIYEDDDDLVPVKYDEIEDVEIRDAIKFLDSLIAEGGIKFEKWTRAYINRLPDSSFAVIEPAYKRGETENKNARHLPHHNEKGGGTRNVNLDIPHLRNALARMGLIKPITDSISANELRSQARAHLLHHVSVLKTYKQEADMVDALKELLANLGVSYKDGDDPVAVLSDYIELLKKEKKDLEEKVASIKLSEANTLKLEERVAELERQLAEKDKKIFFDQMVREGKVTPAERAYFERLYDADSETVKEMLSNREPVVDFEEHGTASDEAVSLEEKRAQRFKELVAGGMDPAEAYEKVMQEEE